MGRISKKVVGVDKNWEDAPDQKKIKSNEISKKKIPTKTSVGKRETHHQTKKKLL